MNFLQMPEGFIPFFTFGAVVVLFLSIALFLLSDSPPETVRARVTTGISLAMVIASISTIMFENTVMADAKKEQKVALVSDFLETNYDLEFTPEQLDNIAALKATRIDGVTYKLSEYSFKANNYVLMELDSGDFVEQVKK